MNITEMCEVGAVRSDVLWRDKDIASIRPQDVNSRIDNTDDLKSDPNHALLELRALLPTRPDVGFLRTDNDFLARFLRARKYKVQDAFVLMCRYWEYRQRNRDLCVGLSTAAAAVRAALLDGTVGVLGERDGRGRPIIIVLASNWNHSKYTIRVIYQAVIVTLEKLVEEVSVQEAGVICVLDFTDFPTRLATSLSPKHLRLFLEGLQDAFPLRLGALHIISPPWYVDAAISLSRPFVKEKIRARTHVHSNNVHTLHAHIPPRILPAELGGEGGEYHALTWASVVLSPTTSIEGMGLSSLFASTTSALMTCAIKAARGPAMIPPFVPTVKVPPPTTTTEKSISSSSSKVSNETDWSNHISQSTLAAVEQSRPPSAYSTDQDEYHSASSNTSPERQPRPKSANSMR